MPGAGGIDRRGAWRWLLPVGLLAAAIMFAVLCGWQVQRLSWKQHLIASVEAKRASPPVPAPGPDRWPDLTSASEYTRVALTGTYLHDKETLVTASTERGPGFWVLTPLVTRDGLTVIVNRGFVDTDHRRPEMRGPPAQASAVTLTGLLRLSEADVWILRRNDPEAGRWYRRDPIEIAHARGIADAAPYFIDAEATADGAAWPVAGMTRLAFQNNHLVYALTWLALALLSAVAAALVIRDGPKAGRQSPSSKASST